MYFYWMVRLLFIYLRFVCSKLLKVMFYGFIFIDKILNADELGDIMLVFKNIGEYVNIDNLFAAFNSFGNITKEQIQVRVWELKYLGI